MQRTTNAIVRKIRNVSFDLFQAIFYWDFPVTDQIFLM